jgi:broad specificity phosphatase PhoE
MHKTPIILDPNETGFLIDGIPAFGQRYTKAMSFHYPEGLAAVSDLEGAYHIREDGTPLYNQRYLESYGYYGGHATVRDEMGFFHIDQTGNPIYSSIFDWAGNYQEGCCVVKDSSGYFHIDAQGQALYAQRYHYVGDFKYGIAVVHTDEGAIHIRKDGTLLNTAVYHDAEPFHKGYAVVSDEGGFFHVDKGGKPIHSYRFKKAEPFYNGISRCITQDGRQIHLRNNGFYTYVSKPNASVGVENIHSLIQQGYKVSLYFRHAERFARPTGEWGGELLLTPNGISQSENFGFQLKACKDCSLHSSPVSRCKQTISFIAKGMRGTPLDQEEFNISTLLGDPGPFDIPGVPVPFLPDTFSVIADQYIAAGMHEGLNPLAQACEQVIEYIKSSTTHSLNVFVTHDFFVAGMQRFLGLRHPKNGDWIDFLEGLCFVNDGSVHGKWLILRGQGKQITS